MEIKNGIIIDGELHELVFTNTRSNCSKCSLRNICKISKELCYVINHEHMGYFIKQKKLKQIVNED